MEKKLQVKDLAVSFRTDNGRVKAVRGINFELYKGETLAIVGESGSGKSVTSKAVIGILAGNSIVESGEIIYDGQDLLKITEDDFHKIRGDKVAMIFQDPLSSLNPIVKIGRQLTEAMILNGKMRQKDCRHNFNTLLANLKTAIAASAKVENPEEYANNICQNFDKFEYKHLELEGAYNAAYDAADDVLYELKTLILEVSKNAAKDLAYRINKVAKFSHISVHDYVVKEEAERLGQLADSLKTLHANFKAAAKQGTDAVNAAINALVDALTEIQGILERATAKTKPNFFAMGYYATFATEPMPELPTDELNVFLRKYLDDNFMLGFIDSVYTALVHSAHSCTKEKGEAIESLKAHRHIFEVENLDKVQSYAALKAMNKEVVEGIDRLELIKDSFAYTFHSGVKSDLDRYFKAITKNAKEEKRYAKQKAKYDALVAKGKEPDSSVVPAAITDLEVVKNNILVQIDRLIENYEQRIEKVDDRDFHQEAVAIIDYLKAQASGVVHRVTKSSAKNKALKLMDEVGIADARIRYNQYPFQFSGGMRQRIVIAIALAADPDILICDEPTTALDVTIQAQILELINKSKKERDLSVIFITHDLGVVANMADRIAVMYAGKIVEQGTAEDIFYDPRHPYTWALLSSMPDLDTNEKLEAIPGTPPNMIYPPVGDAFAERNKYALKIDFEQQPPMFKISDTHSAATWLLHPDAPKVEIPAMIKNRIERMKKNAEEGK